MGKAEEIFECAKNDMRVERYFDTDIQNGEDTLHITSTSDIIKFINFVIDNKD